MIKYLTETGILRETRRSLESNREDSLRPRINSESSEKTLLELCRKMKMIPTPRSTTGRSIRPSCVL